MDRTRRPAPSSDIPGMAPPQPTRSARGVTFTPPPSADLALTPPEVSSPQFAPSSKWGQAVMEAMQRQAMQDYRKKKKPVRR